MHFQAQLYIFRWKIKQPKILQRAQMVLKFPWKVVKLTENCSRNFRNAKCSTKTSGGNYSKENTLQQKFTVRNFRKFEYSSVDCTLSWKFHTMEFLFATRNFQIYKSELLTEWEMP